MNIKVSPTDQSAIQNIAINWASSKSLSSTATLGIIRLFGALRDGALDCTFDEYETIKGLFIAAYKDEMECTAKKAQDDFEELLKVTYDAPIRDIKPKSAKPEAEKKSAQREERDVAVSSLASSNMSTDEMAKLAEHKAIAAIHAKGAEKKLATKEAGLLNAALHMRTKAVADSNKEQSGAYKETIREFLKDATPEQLQRVCECIAEL